MSQEGVAQLKDLTTQEDVRIKSTQCRDWHAKLDQYCQDEETAHAYAQHRAPRILPPMSANSAVKYRRLVAPVERHGYDQNLSRGEAQEEIYNNVSFVVAVRLALGYLNSKSLMGREPGQEPPARFRTAIYVEDMSSCFIGKELSETKTLSITADAAVILRKQGRGAGRTKSASRAPVQRRSLQYSVMMNWEELCAWISVVKDDSFDASMLDLFPVCILCVCGRNGRLADVPIRPADQ